MKLFGGKREEQVEGMLGVDIGTAGIKIVELVPEKGRQRLSTYGYAEKKLDAVGASFLSDPSACAQAIIGIYKEAKMTVTSVVAALPSAEVFHAIITIPVPRHAKEDIRPVIEAQAQKLFSLPLSEMILDSNILDKDLLPKETESEESAKNREKYIRVLLTAAPKTLVERYVAIFKEAKLQLTSLETEIFALIRALIGKDTSRVLLIDIGAERTNLAIVDHGVPYLTRSMKTGGEAITQALAGSMGVSALEAETMKRDLSFNGSGEMPMAMKNALKPIVHEMRYALELYAEQEFHNNRTVEKIIMTGGSSVLPGIAAYVTAELGLNVYAGDPWARVATQTEARGVLDEVGPRLAVAVGLAMRHKEDL